MAKLKPTKAKKNRHEIYKKESRTQKNRDAKLKKHLARVAKKAEKQKARGLEPKADKVAEKALKRAATPKGRSQGKNMTNPNRTKFYVDASGKSVGAPMFVPQMRLNRKTERMELDRSVGADWHKENKGQTNVA